MKLILGGLAVLVLAVAPSAQAATRPDLRVSALAPATVAAGTDVVFTTTVRNTGRGRAGRSVVRVLTASGTRRSVLARATVRALGRGRQARVSLRVTLPATAGTLQVCADALRKVRETRETNNCRAVRVTVSAPAGAPAGAPAPAPAPPLAASAPTGPAPAASSACAATDVPDLQHVDSNCDGIDGTAADSIFVSSAGADANAGTQAAPKRTVAAGIAAAAQTGRSAVLISAGQFNGRPQLVSGISLYGAYDPSTWQRSDLNVTWIAGELTNGGSEGVRAENIIDVTTLQRLRITSPQPASGSSYGVVAVNASRLRLERVDLTAGNGGKGANGNPGWDGGTAQPGAAGKGGGCDSNVAGAGGQGGGAGGPGFGGAGGTGGYGSFVVHGLPGLPGSGAVPGGVGGFTGDPGKPGANGSNGLAGATGAAGQPGFGGEIVGTAWRSDDGEMAAYGVWGQGGGGGGGGGGQDVWGYYGGGNGGGGGGEGGHGGAGGQGGKGGGGSFGLFVLYSPGLTVTDSRVASSAGGYGGAGGWGGKGGNGGAGGAGAKVCLAEVGAGGTGGSGGRGGDGGSGGSGAGGPSYAVYGVGGTLNISSTILAHGTPGLGGSPGGSADRSGV